MTISEIACLIILLEIFFLGGALSLAISNYTWFYFAPKYIYKNSKLNKFGCLCMTLFYFCIFPVYTITVTVMWLLYKLFHTGRE